MDARCWKCGKELGDLPKRLSPKETCPFCLSYLHCCKNCINYQPGLANDCKIPGTDPIADRESINYCDEFSMLGKFTPPKLPGEEDRFSHLFRE
jgi:hypothetical protein